MVPRICIVTPNASEYSETFIHHHMSQLPDVKLCLHGKGNFFPTHTIDDEDISNKYALEKSFRRIVGFRRKEIRQEITAWGLAKYLRQNDINILLAEYGTTAAFILQACVMSRIPLVVHFHGYDAHNFDLVEKYQKEYQQIFITAAALVAASQDMKNRLIELGAPPDRIFVNPYGVDLKQFTLRTQETEPQFLAVGRFVDKKAPQITLLAFHRVLQQQPNCRLVMVGDGPLQEACRQIAVALRIDHAVRFKGACSPNEIKELLHSSRAFIQHSTQASYGDSESLGVVFLEAAACGVPSITTRHDGIPEVVLHEQTGLLADELDLDTFSANLLTLAQNPQLAAQYGKAARTRVEEKFTLEISLNNLRQIIGNALSNQ